MSIAYYKLDNPAWFALLEVKQDKAMEIKNMACYLPEFCGFVAAQNPKIIQKDISEYLRHTPSFYFIGDQPKLPDTARYVNELVCNQMLLETPISDAISSACVSLNQPNQLQDLFDLVQQVQPGYFHPQTAKMGAYYGIYKNNKLIAAAGERIKLNTFTEVSAIVIHPNHRGQGCAKKLISHATNQIFKAGKIPFLHV